MTHFLKFLVVGTIGFIINTVALILGVRVGMRPSLSGPLGAELAIISNFLLNNFWTFSDKTITSWTQLPPKFITFNILSLGSTIIQFIFLKTGEILIGLEQYKRPIMEWEPVAKIPLAITLRNLPVIKQIEPKLSAYMIFYMAGVGVGLIVNYFVYSTIIWK